MERRKAWSRVIRTTWDQFTKEYMLPLFMELVILGLVTAASGLLTGKGPELEQAVTVGSDMSSPTLGRLIFGGLAFIGFFVSAVLSSGSAKAGKDTQAFYLGYTAGLLLWQVIGEVCWHYSIGGVHFVPMESVATFPLAVLFIMLMVYGKKNHSFDWGIWCMLVSFACCWFSRYIMAGTHPFVAGLIDADIWNRWVSSAAGLLALLFSMLFLLFRAKTTRGRMLASMIAYASLAVIYFGAA